MYVNKLYNRVLNYAGYPAGAVDAVRQLYSIQANPGYGDVRKRARSRLELVALGQHPATGLVYAPAVVKVARSLWQPEGAPWQDGNGVAPIAGNGNGGPTPKPSEAAVPPARKMPPCKYGPRINGRCPTKAEAGLTEPAPARPPREKRPCAYGPRDEYGRCPPKPRAARAKKMSKATAALMRRAQTAAGNVAAAGARGAIKAVGAGLAAAGGAGVAVGALAAILAAGAAGWLIGQKILHQGETKQEKLAAAAVDRIHARLAMQDKLGRQPTLAEQKPITDAYNERVRQIKLGIA